ncbi:DUF2730 family protein [Salmonella enterica subsp. enterica]|nr:DUF2730 family protein [Salmonella enterica subsp. enterica]
MGISELNFDWNFLQWVVMAVVGVYTWLIGRQSASGQELMDLRTRIVRLEEQIAQVPTQKQVADMMSKLSSAEAHMSGLSEKFDVVSRRLESINNFLLQNK